MDQDDPCAGTMVDKTAGVKGPKCCRFGGDTGRDLCALDSLEKSIVADRGAKGQFLHHWGPEIRHFGFGQSFEKATRCAVQLAQGSVLFQQPQAFLAATKKNEPDKLRLVSPTF